MAPVASIVVPTRERPGYLHVTLDSIAPQASAAGAELIVVEDGGTPCGRLVAERHGARYLAHPAPQGPNAARNTGIEAAGSDLIVLVDDDVEAPEGWLDALLAGAATNPGDDVLGGPIRPRLEGTNIRLCGREGPPVTFLDLGSADHETDFVWSANMAIRRAALDRVGAFDASLEIYGDEEEWQRRHLAAGGRTRYLAAAGLEHRRAGPDARLGGLMRAAYRRGRNARRFDARKGATPSLAHEARVLAGCLAHVVRYRCTNGFVMGAEAAGRMREALAR
jgi:glycosyltransferase involved in cell wall biosynthesis